MLDPYVGAGRVAFSAADADWVIESDVNEFWWPRGGSLQEVLASVPERYGLVHVPITGLSPESEPSPQQLANVVRIVRRTRTTTVFFETLVSPRLADTVARETGARTAVLDPIEGLTPAEQARGEDYLSLMRQNLAALRRALGCR